MQKVKSIMVFSNLNIAAFDMDGQQIPELQVNLGKLWAEHARKLGYDPTGMGVEAQGQRPEWRESVAFFWRQPDEEAQD